MNKQNFYDLNFDQLKNFLIEKAEVDKRKAKMRAQQMFNAVYKKNIKKFDELTTFGLELRDKIKNLISLEKPKIIDIQKSKDGTIKFLLELKDKRNVETVLIPDKSQSRYTICLSVSVGCYPQFLLFLLESFLIDQNLNRKNFVYSLKKILKT